MLKNQEERGVLVVLAFYSHFSFVVSEIARPSS